MLQELVCHHRNLGTKRYLRLSRAVYRVGKALDNDIVLLDGDVPSYLNTLEKKNGKYVWAGPQNESCGYDFKIRNIGVWIATLAFVITFLCALVFFEHFYTSSALFSTKTQSLPARGTFGNLDSKNPTRVLKFEFQPHAGRYSVLHYTPGNLEGDQDLQVLINGKFLGFVPESPNRWNVEQIKLIPSEMLVEKNNLIEFVYRAKNLNAWGIRDVYVDEASDPPAILSGEELIQNAQKLFREKNIRKGNLVRAEQLAKQAGQFYYSKKQSYPPSLQGLIEKIRNEKVQMISDYQMLIQKYRQQGELKKESRIFRKLMDELIDPVDPDRNKILRERDGTT